MRAQTFRPRQHPPEPLFARPAALQTSAVDAAKTASIQADRSTSLTGGPPSLGMKPVLCNDGREGVPRGTPGSASEACCLSSTRRATGHGYENGLSRDLPE
jgi:hypothetical protein